jgi:hypothetical protein
VFVCPPLESLPNPTEAGGVIDWKAIADQLAVALRDTFRSDWIEQDPDLIEAALAAYDQAAHGAENA